MHDELEQYTLYRLIKAIYYAILIFLVVFIIVAGYVTRPYKAVDYDKSYFTCLNSYSRTFSETGIYSVSKDDGAFDRYNDSLARQVCATNPYPHGSFTSKGYLDPEQAAKFYGYVYNPDGEYNFTIKTKVIGSWEDVFMWWFFAGIASYVVLNIFRESLIYIFYGRKATWSWLIKPVKVLFNI